MNIGQLPSIREIPTPVASGIAAVTLWEILSLLVGANYFPHLLPVLQDLGLLVRYQAFWSSLLATIIILTSGMAIGLVLSLVFGLLLSISRFIDESFTSSLAFIRCIPAVTLLPVLIATVGANTSSVVLLTTFVVTTKLLIYVSRSFHMTHQEVVDFARSSRLRFSRRVSLIYLPSAISQITTGIQVTAILAFGTVVTCGIAAGTPGIGSALLLAEESAQHERIFSYVIVMGLTGVSVHNLFNLIQIRIKRILRSAV